MPAEICCDRCGASDRSTAQFCEHCGASVDAIQGQTGLVAATDATAACQFFTPDHGGACTYVDKKRHAARPFLEELRRRVVYGEKKAKGTLGALEEDTRRAPALAEWVTQTYIRCKGTRKQGYNYVALPNQQCSCDEYVPVGTPTEPLVEDELRAICDAAVAAGARRGATSVRPPVQSPSGRTTSSKSSRAPSSGTLQSGTSLCISLVSAPLFAEDEGKSYPEDEQLVQDIRDACSGIALRASDVGKAVAFRDAFDGPIGGRKRDVHYQFVKSAHCVLVLMTPSLLESHWACDLVETALDVQDEHRNQNRRFLIIPVIGIACDWEKKFPHLRPNLNGYPAPPDGIPLNGRRNRAQMLRKLGSDLGDLLIPDEQ